MLGVDKRTHAVDNPLKTESSCQTGKESNGRLSRKEEKLKGSGQIVNDVLK